MSESKTGTASLIVSIVALSIAFFSLVYGANSYNQGQQIAILAHNDTTFNTQLIHLRSIDSAAMVSEDTLASINEKQAYAILKLTTLNDRAQTQIGDLIKAVKHLQSIDTLTQHQLANQESSLQLFQRQIAEEDTTDIQVREALLSELKSKTFALSETIQRISSDSFEYKKANETVNQFLEGERTLLMQLTLNKKLYLLAHTRASIIAFNHFIDLLDFQIPTRDGIGQSALEQLPTLFRLYTATNDSAQSAEEIARFHYFDSLIVTPAHTKFKKSQPKQN